MTATLISTIAVFIAADSRIPLTSKTVTAAVIRTAGRLNTAVTSGLPATLTTVPGAALSTRGNDRPTWFRKAER